MDKFLKLWATEPAVIIGAVRAILVASVGFGLNLSTEQITSLVLAVEAIGALVTRQSVFAPATAQRMVEGTADTLGDTVSATIDGLSAKSGKHRGLEDVVSDLPDLSNGTPAADDPT